MVNAILEGKKTQTRRIVKLPSWASGWEGFDAGEGKAECDTNNGCVAEIPCPYGERGDRLWVRETFRLALSDRHQCWAYRADNKCKCGADAHSLPTAIWKPSIFMPRDACRIELEVLGVRVERLQNIKEEDAIAEGIETIKIDGEDWYENYSKVKICLSDPISSFKSLWISINGANSWLQNPYVWVVNFNKI